MNNISLMHALLIESVQFTMKNTFIDDLLRNENSQPCLRRCASAPAKLWMRTPCTQPLHERCPVVEFIQGGYNVRFGFSIRKARGVELGLVFFDSPVNGKLVVQRVLSRSAIHAWNMQVVESTHAGKLIVPGDRLVGVNNVFCTIGMLQECRKAEVLRLVWERGTIMQSKDAQI